MGCQLGRRPVQLVPGFSEVVSSYSPVHPVLITVADKPSQAFYNHVVERPIFISPSSEAGHVSIPSDEFQVRFQNENIKAFGSKVMVHGKKWILRGEYNSVC